MGEILEFILIFLFILAIEYNVTGGISTSSILCFNFLCSITSFSFVPIKTNTSFLSSISAGFISPCSAVFFLYSLFCRRNVYVSWEPRQAGKRAPLSPPASLLSYGHGLFFTQPGVVIAPHPSPFLASVFVSICAR